MILSINIDFLFIEIWSKFLENCEKKIAKFLTPEDAQCATDATPTFTVLRYLVFEIWSILYSKFLEN